MGGWQKTNMNIKSKRRIKLFKSHFHVLKISLMNFRTFFVSVEDYGSRRWTFGTSSASSNNRQTRLLMISSSLEILYKKISFYPPAISVGVKSINYEFKTNSFSLVKFLSRHFQNPPFVLWAARHSRRRHSTHNRLGIRYWNCCSLKWIERYCDLLRVPSRAVRIKTFRADNVYAIVKNVKQVLSHTFALSSVTIDRRNFEKISLSQRPEQHEKKKCQMQLQFYGQLEHVGTFIINFQLFRVQNFVWQI